MNTVLYRVNGKQPNWKLQCEIVSEKWKKRQIYFRRYFTVLVAFLHNSRERGAHLYFYFILFFFLLVFIEFFSARVKCFLSKWVKEDRVGSYRSRIRFCTFFVAVVFVPKAIFRRCQIMTTWSKLLFIFLFVFRENTLSITTHSITFTLKFDIKQLNPLVQIINVSRLLVISFLSMLKKNIS